MSKLHELLAVEGNLKGQAEKVRNELKATFHGKRHLFGAKVVTFHPIEEGKPSETEEQLDLNTTVPQELKWIRGIIGNALDVSYQVAEGNTKARADITLEDGTTLLSGVPATALLELEKRVNEIHELVTSIPTLDPAKGFKQDPNKGNDVYVARDDTRQRTKKIVRPIVLYPATPEHPAQTQLVSEDVPSGRLVTQEWSGLIHPVAKADMLERVEVLRRAVKKARAKANETEVKDVQRVGDALLTYVFGK